MTVFVGVLGAALLFGLFTWLRPRDSGCTGTCAGCTRDGACEAPRERRVGP
jgi:hypothetical protein